MKTGWILTLLLVLSSQTQVAESGESLDEGIEPIPFQEVEDFCKTIECYSDVSALGCAAKMGVVAASASVKGGKSLPFSKVKDKAARTLERIIRTLESDISLKELEIANDQKILDQIESGAKEAARAEVSSDLYERNRERCALRKRLIN